MYVLVVPVPGCWLAAFRDNFRAIRGRSQFYADFIAFGAYGEKVEIGIGL